MNTLSILDFSEKIQESFVNVYTLNICDIEDRIVDNFKKGIIDEDEFAASLDLLEKARKDSESVGTIKEWSGRRFQKQPDGKWKPVRSEKKVAKQLEQAGKDLDDFLMHLKEKQKSGISLKDIKKDPERWALKKASDEERAKYKELKGTKDALQRERLQISMTRTQSPVLTRKQKKDMEWYHGKDSGAGDIYKEGKTEGARSFPYTMGSKWTGD